MAVARVSLRSVLGAPGVARLFGASLVGRLPAGALGLVLILRAREAGLSYAVSGVVGGAFALGLAVGAPVVGRAVDARGQTRVLALSAALSSAALGALALVPNGSPPAVLVGLAALAGAAHPPLAACLRALWPYVLGDRSRRHAAYTLESVAVEITYVLGPLVLVGAIAARSASLALGTCALLLVAGTTAFAAAPVSRRWLGEGGGARGPAGALAAPGVRLLCLVALALGTSFRAIELSVAAFAEGAGSRGAAGPLLAAWGAGSIPGGLLTARLGAPERPVARLAVLLASLAVGDALLAAAPGLWGLAALRVAAGLCIAPVFAILYGVIGDVARAGTVTEAFTWLTTGIGAGLAAGAPLAGVLAVHGDGRAGFLVAAGAAAGAALAVLAGRRLMA